MLGHRNVAATGTTSETRWVPNGVDSWGAGTSIISEFGIVNWTTIQRRISETDNANHTLYPVWMPRQSQVLFDAGESDYFEFIGDTLAVTFPTTHRLTGQPIALPSTEFELSNGTWEQIGWTWQLGGKFLTVNQPLPAGDFEIGATIPATFGGVNEGWNNTRTIYAVWRRVINRGSVIITFIGGPGLESFMEEEIDAYASGLKSTMQFVISDGDIQCATTLTEFLLPSFTNMTLLGEQHELEFKGWFIRTSWAPVEIQRLDDEATPDDQVSIPWVIGILAPNLEQFIWIEALWG
jgi:hypothetical protein